MKAEAIMRVLKAEAFATMFSQRCWIGVPSLLSLHILIIESVFRLFNSFHDTIIQHWLLQSKCANTQGFRFKISLMFSRAAVWLVNYSNSSIIDKNSLQMLESKQKIGRTLQVMQYLGKQYVHVAVSCPGSSVLLAFVFCSTEELHSRTSPFSSHTRPMAVGRRIVQCYCGRSIFQQCGKWASAVLFTKKGTNLIWSITTQFLSTDRRDKW